MMTIQTETSRNPIVINDDLSTLLPEVAEILEDSVMETVLVGGRPVRWHPTKSGRPPLRGRGVLWSTLDQEIGSNYAQVSWGAGLAYARIHQHGGLAGRNHSANIIARPVQIQTEDIEKIRELFVGKVVFTTNIGASILQ